LVCFDPEAPLLNGLGSLQAGDHAAVHVSCRVEVVGRVEPLVPEVLEDGAVHFVGARFRDDADLAARAGAIFSRVAARLDAELLDVFEARLELERRIGFAVDVARRRVDDGRPFDAVVFDHILLVRASAEADVLPGTRPGILRSRRLQHELGHLAPVDGQLSFATPTGPA